MNRKTCLDDLVWETKRVHELSEDQKVYEILNSLIFEDEVALEARRHRKPLEFNLDALEVEAVLYQAIKILAIMEVSDNKEEFEKLMAKKKKKPITKEEITDFDKILKGLLNVPPPKKDKKD